MRRSSKLLAAVAALGLVLQPGLALARAGNGGSFGSRGGYTFSAPPATRTAPYSAAPIERSLTPRPAAPGYYGNPGAPAYGAPYRSGFGSALLGGLVGVGLGSMLFGHGFGGGFGFLWFLVQIALLVVIARFVWRLLSGNRPRPAFAGAANLFSRTQGAAPGPRPMGSGRAAAPPVAVGPADYQAFEQTLGAVQDAWSRSDMNALGRLATPEMVSYFADQLADYASRGQRNSVTDVRLLSGDLAQAWAEQGREYATVAMRFSMIDVTRDAAGRIVDGSPTEHVVATELWTFTRVPGGRWSLSAIQQAR